MGERTATKPPTVSLDDVLDRVDRKAWRSDVDALRYHVADLRDDATTARRELEAARAATVVPLTSSPIADTGDYSVACSNCGEEQDEPHTWKECAERLRKHVDHAEGMYFEQSHRFDEMAATLAAVEAIGWRAIVERDEALRVGERNVRDAIESNAAIRVLAAERLERAEKAEAERDTERAAREKAEAALASAVAFWAKDSGVEEEAEIAFLEGRAPDPWHAPCRARTARWKALAKRLRVRDKERRREVWASKGWRTCPKSRHPHQHCIAERDGTKPPNGVDLPVAICKWHEGKQ